MLKKLIFFSRKLHRNNYDSQHYNINVNEWKLGISTTQNANYSLCNLINLVLLQIHLDKTDSILTLVYSTFFLLWLEEICRGLQVQMTVFYCLVKLCFLKIFLFSLDPDHTQVQHTGKFSLERYL